MAIHLTVLVPGILGPVRGVPQAHLPLAEVLPALSPCLSRAKRAEFRPRLLEPALFKLFGIGSGVQDHLPVATLSYLGDFGRAVPGPVLRADPVNLQAGTEGMVLFDETALNLQAAESRALVESYNAAFEGAGYRLEMATSGRWYLHLPRPFRLATESLSAVVGDRIDHSQPAGEDAVILQTMLTECQMLFHDHPVNRLRAETGQREINSLWFWGEGEVGPAPQKRWSHVIGPGGFLSGLADFTASLWREPPAGCAQLNFDDLGGSVLLLLPQVNRLAAHGDLDGWYEAASSLEETWLMPLMARLRSDHVKRLTLIPLDGYRYTFQRRHLSAVLRRLGLSDRLLKFP